MRNKILKCISHYSEENLEMSQLVTDDAATHVHIAQD